VTYSLALFFVAKVAVVDRQPGWCHLISQGDQVAVAQQALKAQFEGQIALLGYDLPQTRLAQDGELPLVLYWKATGPVTENYSVFVHLVRPAVHTWGQDDRLNPGDVPTTRWPADRYVRDGHRLRALPGTPPGEYRIEVGLYELGTGRRLFVLDEDGLPVGQGVVLPQPIRVSRADVSSLANELEARERVEATFGGQVSLLGYSLDPTGDLWLPNFLHLTLFWQAEQASLRDLEVALRLRDAQGVVVAQIEGQPADGHYPTSDWLAGELVRDQHSVWLAQDFRPGRYDVEVSVADVQSRTPLLARGAAADGQGWVFLTQIEVRSHETSD